MDQDDETIKDILQIVTFLKDNMASKDDLVDLATKDNLSTTEERLKRYVDERLEERLTETKSEIIGHIDYFIGLHQKLDTELTESRSKYDRLEEHLHKLAAHVQFELQ